MQYNAALRDQVTVRDLDIVEAARMFAAVDMSAADAEISVWYTKYVDGFWRPITAINLADTDGNPATVADPTWAPLLATPPYPDYPSGYNAFNLTVSHGLEDLFQTRHLQLTLISTAVPGVQRHHDSGRVLRQDVVDAMDARPLLPARSRARAIVNPCRCLLWRVPELVATPREGRSCSGPWVATGRHGVVPSPGGCRCAEGGTPDRCHRDHPARPGVKLERPQAAHQALEPSQLTGVGGRG